MSVFLSLSYDIVDHKSNPQGPQEGEDKRSEIKL